MYKSDQIDYDTFRDALSLLIHNMGRGAQSEIYRVTNIHNVGRLASGGIKSPSIETWMTLHKAYPDAIPEPRLKGGDPIVSNVQNSNTFTGSGGMKTGINYSSRRSESSKEVAELTELLELTKSKLELREMITELRLEVEKAMDKQKKMIEPDMQTA